MEYLFGVFGICYFIYFRNLYVVFRWMYGVELLLGVEINILDGKGNFDLDEDYMKMFDICIVGIYFLCYEYGMIEENIYGMVQVISNFFIYIISYFGDGMVVLYFELMVLVVKEYYILLEINNSFLKFICNKFNVCENNFIIFCLCKKYEVLVILGSDVYILFDIVCYDNLYELLQFIGFFEELIMNCDVKLFKEYFYLQIIYEKNIFCLFW